MHYLLGRFYVDQQQRLKQFAAVNRMPHDLAVFFKSL